MSNVIFPETPFFIYEPGDDEVDEVDDEDEDDNESGDEAVVMDSWSWDLRRWDWGRGMLMFSLGVDIVWKKTIFIIL